MNFALTGLFPTAVAILVCRTRAMKGGNPTARWPGFIFRILKCMSCSSGTYGVAKERESRNIIRPITQWEEQSVGRIHTARNVQCACGSATGPVSSDQTSSAAAPAGILACDSRSHRETETNSSSCHVSKDRNRRPSRLILSSRNKMLSSTAVKWRRKRIFKDFNLIFLSSQENITSYIFSFNRAQEYNEK